MYLTKEEFIVLKRLKEGLSFLQIKEKYGISIGTIDPRMEALCKKYGVTNRLDLIQKADLDKVEICEKGNIPYFKYDNNKGDWLVQKIYISKSDILKLSEIFSQMPDNKDFTLVCCQGTFEYLYLDTPNGKQYVYERIG